MHPSCMCQAGAFLTDLSVADKVNVRMLVARRRLLAWCAILAFTGTFGLGAGMVGHSGPDDDAACFGSAPTDGHPRVQFETATAAPAPTHCPFCHWQRTVGGGSILSADLAVAQFDPIDIVAAVTTRAIGSTAVDERPSRAPPSILLS